MPGACRRPADMAADQAAGLRRRRSKQPPRLVHCCAGTVDLTRRLVRALHGAGGPVLLIDTGGRLFADVQARSLFDWRRQLACGQPYLIRTDAADGWFAPGLRADVPGLRDLAQSYAFVVLDAAPGAVDWAPMADAIHGCVVDTGTTPDDLLQRYALLKTLAGRARGVPLHVGLVGGIAACDRLLAACRHFLEPAFSRCLQRLEDTDDAFAALAARMAGEETRLTARNNTGNT